MDGAVVAACIPVFLTAARRVCIHVCGLPSGQCGIRGGSECGHGSLQHICTHLDVPTCSGGC